MVNYYELLEISQNADRATIEQAIKKTRRLWNNRANNPDATIRAEAERHVREVAEAEKILLNEAAREEYDQQLKQKPGNDSVDQSADIDSDWEDEYFQAYNRDLNDYAAQIAQRVISVDARNGRAWYLYGEALRRGGNLDAAIEALKRATLFSPNDDGIYRQLGFSYADTGQYGDAYKAFKTASTIAPRNGEYRSLCANCLRTGGMVSEAVEEAREGFNIEPTNNVVRFEYFAALYEDVMSKIAYNRSSGKHLIINKRQLDYANETLKAMALTVPSDENKDSCTSAMEEIAQLVVFAESLRGLFKSKYGYEYNYEISNADTRASGLH